MGSSGEDPQNRTFNRELREVAKPSQIKELIPCSLFGVSGGDTYPPRDIWDLKGGKKSKTKKVASSSSVGSRNSMSKADKVKRLKGQDLDSTEQYEAKKKKVKKSGRK